MKRNGNVKVESRSGRQRQVRIERQVRHEAGESVKGESVRKATAGSGEWRRSEVEVQEGNGTARVEIRKVERLR